MTSLHVLRFDFTAHFAYYFSPVEVTAAEKERTNGQRHLLEARAAQPPFHALDTKYAAWVIHCQAHDFARPRARYRHSHLHSPAALGPASRAETL